MGSQIKYFRISAKTVRHFTEKVKNEIEAIEEKGYKRKDICVVVSFLDSPASKFLFLAYLELNSMKLGIEILFQCETLSQEWPIVIVCGKNEI